MGKDLGEIKNLKRASVWAHEAHEFAPWFAQEENTGSLPPPLALSLKLLALSDARLL